MAQRHTFSIFTMPIYVASDDWVMRNHIDRETTCADTTNIQVSSYIGIIIMDRYHHNERLRMD